MNIQLKTLELQNFKGVPALRVEFSAGVTTIYGANGTGKSTIYDALLWLFFGKDSAGNAKFTVKPVGVSGVTPTVTAVCLVDGAPRKLSKVLRERWAKPRGSTETQYMGDTVDYFIDDVPRKESEYKRILSEYIPEERFSLLMGVHRFAQELPWRQRRAILAELCGLPDDETLLYGAPQFAPLRKAMHGTTVEAYQIACAAERKGVAHTLDSLPIRMDECRRSVQALETTDFAAARHEQEQLSAQCRELRAALAKLEGDALLTEARAAHKAIWAEQRALEAENTAHRQAQAAKDPRAQAQTEMQQAEQARRTLEAELASLGQSVEAGEKRLAAYDAQMEALEQETFSPAVCPTCGQGLPPEQLAAAQARWQTARQTRRETLCRDRAFLQGEVERARMEYARKTDERAGKLEQSAACAARLAACPAADAITDLPDYPTRKCALDLQAAEVLDRIHALESGQENERDRLQRALSAHEARLAVCAQTLAQEKRLHDAHARLAQLAAERDTCAARLGALDDSLALCEAFSRYKVQFLTHAVNARFRLAQFRLFREQLNGGIAECCEVVVDGVPYEDLNHAMQVNAGLDIIRTLSAHFGVSVPVVVDNAESITQLETAGLQAVRLVVSAPDTVLRVEQE